MDGERQLEELSEEACRARLRSAVVGRFAVAPSGEAPFVFPVNHVVDEEGAVVFRSDLGEKVWALREAPASFEVDGVDAATRTGWSVLVRGVAYEVPREAVGSLDVEPW